MSSVVAVTRSRFLQTDQLPMAVACALLAAIFLSSPNFRMERGPESGPFAGDVLQEWIGGYVVRFGDYDRFYDAVYAQQLEHDEALVGMPFRKGEYFPLVYPPFYYLLVSPLSWLPFPAAALLWASMMVLAYLAAWRLFQGSLGRADARCDVLKTGSTCRGTQGLPVAWLLPLSLFFMPLVENVTTCQKGSVLLLLLTSAYALLDKQRPYWAGVVFGLIAFKPQFALPMAIAMLCKRQWRFVAGGLTTGIVLVGLCLLMGADVCWQYVTFSTHAGEYLQNAGYDLTKSHAWSGFFTLLLGGPSTAVTMLTAAASGVTIALAALALRGPIDGTQPHLARQFSALVIATALLSPHLYTYDLTILLLPLGLVAASREASSSLKWLALLIFCTVGVSSRLAALTGIQLSVPLMLAFLWAQQKAAGIAASGVISDRQTRLEACLTSPA